MSSLNRNLTNKIQPKPVLVCYIYIIVQQYHQNIFSMSSGNPWQNDRPNGLAAVFSSYLFMTSCYTHIKHFVLKTFFLSNWSFTKEPHTY